MNSDTLPPHIPEVIAERIRAGELPSIVLRSLLSQFPQSHKNDYAHELAEAFPDQDSFSLIYPVWHWKEREKSEAWDSFFDYRLIRQLLAAGVALPWNEEHCVQELARIASALEEIKKLAQAKADQASSFETLKATISSFEGKAMCIEARWDGDSNGWFIRLFAVMREAETWAEKFLVCISKGSDARLFQGMVPPWPEAERAKEVGEQLALHLGAEFYFASPDTPNDDLPSWLEQQASS